MKTRNPVMAGPVASLKKAAIMAVLLVPLVPGFGMAAQIYGSLTENGRPVANAGIKVQCDQSYDATTDSNGAYNLFVPEGRRCLLTVTLPNRSVKPFPVYPHDNPVGYDFELRQGQDGYMLIRR